jgi:glycopeptide antibiotics resistance protein
LLYFKSNVYEGEQKGRMKRNSSEKKLFKIFISAFRSGLLGFAIFFSVEFLSKGLAVFLNIQAEFAVDIWDVYLSSIGFVLTFIISFLSSLSSKEEKKEVITELKPETRQKLTVPHQSRKAV